MKEYIMTQKTNYVKKNLLLPQFASSGHKLVLFVPQFPADTNTRLAG